MNPPLGTGDELRVVHASADASTVAVDVGNDGTPEIASLARFADTGAGGVALPAGSPLAIGIRTSPGLAKVTSLTTPALPAGSSLAASGETFRLLVVDATSFPWQAVTVLPN